MYVKLFSTILTSSVWAEDAATRLVWITLLAMADKEGDVYGSVSGLARMANVSVEDTRRALQLLESPDSESQTPDHEGRRIISRQGGWHIVNYAKYRAIQDEQSRRDTWRKATRKYRQRHQVSTSDVDAMLTGLTSAQMSTEAEAEAEAEAKAEASTTTTTRAGVAFEDAAQQAAYLNARRAARDPDAFDATIRATIDGMHPPGYPAALVGQAILEIAASDGRITPAALRAFCRRLAQPDAPARSARQPQTRFDRTRAAIAEFLAEPDHASPISPNGLP
jgi:hypothetical protein